MMALLVVFRTHFTLCAETACTLSRLLLFSATHIVKDWLCKIVLNFECSGLIGTCVLIYIFGHVNSESESGRERV